jgi:sugar/nucleoside kinase (ribokinase family)
MSEPERPTSPAGGPAPAVVAGHICLDIIPDLSAFTASGFFDAFRPGRLLEVGAATTSTGGAVSNTGLALSRLGVPSTLVCKVGDDPFGQIVRSIVSSHDPTLAAGVQVDAAASTSYSVIVSAPDSDRIFLHHPGAGDSFAAADVADDLLARAALFHFGYPPVMRRMYREEGRELVELFRRAKESGATSSLDLALPDPGSESGRADWPRILASVLPQVDLFLPSAEELLAMLGRQLFDQLARRGPVPDGIGTELLRELADEALAGGAAVVGLKLGERGLYLRTAAEKRLGEMGRARPANPAAWAGRELWAPCFRVQVAGTTGAGDATVAGFLAALLRGSSLERAVTSAVAVGACNVETVDSLGGILGWEETQARIEAGWERLPVRPEGGTWDWDEANGLWTTS